MNASFQGSLGALKGFFGRLGFRVSDFGHKSLVPEPCPFVFWVAFFQPDSRNKGNLVIKGLLRNLVSIGIRIAMLATMMMMMVVTNSSNNCNNKSQNQKRIVMVRVVTALLLRVLLLLLLLLLLLILLLLRRRRRRCQLWNPS